MSTQSKEAPGELALIRAFVNTRDVEEGTDELTDAAALARWLAGHGLMEKGAAARPGHVRRARALREALREAAARQQRRPAGPAGGGRRCGCRRGTRAPASAGGR